MALSKQKFREIVFQLLYSFDFAGDEPEAMAVFLMEHHEITKKNFHEANEEKHKIVQHLEAIDREIQEASKEYALDRISKIEKNLLRLGVYELLFVEGLPPKVALAESVRLARKFATPEGSAFVNAVLDAIYKKKYEKTNHNTG